MARAITVTGKLFGARLLTCTRDFWTHRFPGDRNETQEPRLYNNRRHVLERSLHDANWIGGGSVGHSVAGFSSSLSCRLCLRNLGRDSLDSQPEKVQGLSEA